MKKSTWVLLSSFGTMILLYLIGFVFNLSIFEFKYSIDGIAEIALLPIAIGIVVGIVAERIVRPNVIK